MVETPTKRQVVLALDPDTSDAAIEDARERMEKLGWRVESSRGREQLILSLSGGASEEAVRAAFSSRQDVDVIPVSQGLPYRKIRSRQRFLSGLVGGLALLVAVAVTIPVVSFLIPPADAHLDARRVRAASVTQMPENSSRLVRFEGQPVLLIHQTRDRYFALSATCTYMAACQLEWSTERLQLMCPCHGCVYDVRGNIVEGPPSVPLARYAVEYVQDQIYISKGR